MQHRLTIATVDHATSPACARLPAGILHVLRAPPAALGRDAMCHAAAWPAWPGPPRASSIVMHRPNKTGSGTLTSVITVCAAARWAVSRQRVRESGW